MQNTSKYIDAEIPITFHQFISILKKLPLDKKIEIENILEKEIDLKREVPKGFVPAKKKGSYTSGYGIWKDMQVSVEEFRKR